MHLFFTSTFNRLLVSVLLAMVVAALGAYSVLTMRTAEITKEMPATISVNGEGTVSVVPDVAQFSFSVVTKGATGDEAQATSSTKVKSIVAFLVEQGVAEADVKTAEYTLYPVYTYSYESEAVCDGWNCPPPKEIPDGFEVSQTVTVKVRDTAKAGALVAGATERGATNISGITFVLDDEKASRDEARNAAIEDAKQQAQVIADQFGMKLTRMTGFYETQDYYAPAPYSSEYSFDMAKSEASGEPLLPAGEREVKSTVTVSYEME